MDRDGVGVIDPAVVEVVAIEDDVLPARDVHDHVLRRQFGDDTSHAVVDGEVGSVREVLVRMVAAQHDLIPDGELTVAEVQLGGGVEFAGVGEQCSGLPVEEAGLAAGAGEEQGVGAGAARLEPVGEGDGVEVLGLVADDDSTLFSVGVEGGRDVPAAQFVQRGALPGVDLAPVGGQLDDAIAERVEGGAERATGGDLGELVVVADEDHLRSGLAPPASRPRRRHACPPSRLRRSTTSVVAAHLALLDAVTSDRRRCDAGTVLQLPCRPGGRSQSDDLPAGRFVESADGSERVGLAGARSADEHGDGRPCRGQPPDGLGLVVPQR